MSSRTILVTNLKSVQHAMCGMSMYRSFTIFPLFNLVAVGSSGILKAKQKLGVTFNFDKQDARTTDAQRGNSLHCTAENSLPLPNF